MLEEALQVALLHIAAGPVVVVPGQAQRRGAGDAELPHQRSEQLATRPLRRGRSAAARDQSAHLLEEDGVGLRVRSAGGVEPAPLDQHREDGRQRGAEGGAGWTGGRGWVLR